MPEIYREIESARDLMEYFSIEQNGQWYALPDLIEAANGRQGDAAFVALGSPRSAAVFFDPVNNEHNFEKYIAFRLLKMDRVIERRSAERQDSNERE